MTASRESSISAAGRKIVSGWGWRIWRNNRGAGKLENGSYVRWGLCNETPAIGRRFRSADYIGIRPVRIRPEHVGRIVGQFVSIEFKRPGPRSEDPDHVAGQLAWRDLVRSLGGYAEIVDDPNQIEKEFHL